MAYNKKRNRNKEEYQKKTVIRCNHHQKPVFDIDTCPEIMLKSKENANKQCKHCQHSY